MRPLTDPALHRGGLVETKDAFFFRDVQEAFRKIVQRLNVSARKFATTATAGSSVYDIVHGLGTTDIASVSAIDPSGVPDPSITWVATDQYTVQVTFGAITGVDYRIVVVG